ncbi:MAG: ankyrin repeat domain-containing protein [Anaerolineales bacterium]|nr:ankyrin repeat domain-containing protein [Anaerolineales bacterium]
MNTLIEAAIQGDSRLVREYIQQGISPNLRDQHGETALTWAAHLGHTAVVKDLLAAGADRETVGTFLQATPLQLAAHRGHRGIVALLAVFADVNVRDLHGTTALMLALDPKEASQIASHRVYAILQTLIQAGAMLDLQDQQGNTALIWAVQTGNIEATRLLYAAGANPRISNKTGKNALEYANEHGDKIFLQLFLSK